MDFEVISAPELAFQQNCGPHIRAEGRRVYAAGSKEGLVGHFVHPFVEEIRDATLATGFILGKTSGRCGGRAATGRARVCWGRREDDFQAITCLRSEITNSGPNTGATGVVPG